MTSLTTSDTTLPMDCAAFDARHAAYLAGMLSEVEAEQHEAHAAECARCEAMLEASTRVSVASFAPPLPAELRAATLTAVSAARAPRAGRAMQRAWQRWGVAGGTLLAAAAVLTIVVVRRDVFTGALARDGGTQGGTQVATVDTSALPDDPTMRASLRRAAHLAGEPAREEFLQLDAAAAELEAALMSTPDDRDLRDGLAAVRARRDELSRRVKEASS